ncbi:MAG: hypothetical protein F6K18_19715, partial [Okeania sp. SIO2C2]|uniref:DUF5801 repeats-in-toxin domain-containing protein n=1 Tax=Okeania sp. SIO2C2 TaxID=2607787 RepID=UPI0013BC806F
MADLIFTLNNDVTTIHDETTGLQNTPPTLDTTTDDNGNDIAVGALLVEFSTRLNDLEADPSGAIGAALSGYDGSNTGSDVFTIDPGGFAIDNLALTDTNGDPLNGLDSGLTTVDGDNRIFLYTDPTNDNIVLGREGSDPNDNIVLAIYLDESPDLTAGKIWTVQYEAIFHDKPGDGTGGSYNEPLDLTDKLFVTASQDLEFNLANAPSGQNLFIMFGDGNITDGNDEVGIVATGKFPANESEPDQDINDGDTVNTSQAGGPTTFGVNNQQINEGEGIYFTFVTGPNSDFTVPNLTQTEADVEANIQFNDFLDAEAAEFEVTQLQSGKTAVVKVAAYNETQAVADASAENFVDGLNNDDLVPITSVEVVDFDGGGEINIINNGNGTFNIEGVEADDIIRYFTESDHNRVLIENDGDGKGQDSADFDIGGFQLIQANTATQEVGSTVYWEDDGPGITVEAIADADPLMVDETDLTTDASANFADHFSNTPEFGADGEGSVSSSYSLGGFTDGTDSGLDDSATGGDVLLYLNGGVVEGRLADDTIVFTVSVDGSGTVTLDQQRAVVHPDETNPDDAVSLAADLISLTRTDTITDGDGDTATDDASIDLGPAITFKDDGPGITVEAIADADPLMVDETDLTTDASANFADHFSNTPEFGADGEGSVSSSYSLGGFTDGTDSGLDDSATGGDVLLYLNGGVVEGR